MGVNISGPDQLKGFLADHIMDGREARLAIKAFPKAEALSDALAALGVTDSATVATQIGELAKSPVYRFIDVGGEDGNPDLSHELVASVTMPELGNDPLPGATLDAEMTLTSWAEFGDFARALRVQLDERRETDPDAHVTLVLNVHGNNGTGLKLLVPKDSVAEDGVTTREIQGSVASVAWINQQLADAGFTPADLTVISEACNAGQAYVTTVDGFNADERKKATVNARMLGRTEGNRWLYDKGNPALGLAPGRKEGDRFKVSAPVFFNLAPGKKGPAFTWLGFVQGQNVSAAAMHRLAGVQTTPLYKDAADGKRGAVSGEAVIGVLNNVPVGIGVRSEALDVDGQAIRTLRERAMANGAQFYHAEERKPTD